MIVIGVINLCTSTHTCPLGLLYFRLCTFSVPTGLIGAPSPIHKGISVVLDNMEITDFIHELGFLDAKEAVKDSIKHFQKIYQVEVPYSLYVNNHMLYSICVSTFADCSTAC